MNTNLFELFYRVSHYKSFSEASEMLFISQPAISSQILKLEKQIGVQLFNRLRNGITLTQEGQMFYNYVASGIEDFNNGCLYLKNLKNFETGSLRIGTSATICKTFLIPYLKEFHSKYEKVDLQIINGQNDKIIQQFFNGEIDVLFLTWYNFGRENELDIYKISDIQDIFICNQNIYEQTKNGISIKQIAEYPLIAQKKPSSTRNYMDAFLINNNVEPAISIESVSFDLITSLVGAGLGIGFSTKEFIEESLKQKVVYQINIKESIPKRSIDMITKKTIVPNIFVKALINIIHSMKGNI